MSTVENGNIVGSDCFSSTLGRCLSRFRRLFFRDRGAVGRVGRRACCWSPSWAARSLSCAGCPLGARRPERTRRRQEPPRPRPLVERPQRPLQAERFPRSGLLGRGADRASEALVGPRRSQLPATGKAEIPVTRSESGVSARSTSGRSTPFRRGSTLIATFLSDPEAERGLSPRRIRAQQRPGR